MVKRMTGPHDLGGQSDYGLVNPKPESDEELFSADWERRIFAITLAAGALGKWNLDQSRYCRERQSQEVYLQNIYYRNWLIGLESLLLETNLLTSDELETGISKQECDPEEITPLRAADVCRLLRKGKKSSMVSKEKAAFAPGDIVRVIKSQTNGHTRVPRYIEGKEGVICASYGSFVFPDKHAEGLKSPEHLYNVEFQSRKLWTSGVARRDTVRLDLFEPYLEMRQ